MQNRNEDGVAEERSEWRDSRLSARHREYGFDCPAVDVDFLMIEYDHGLPVAVVDYKLAGAPIPSRNNPNQKAMSRLYDEEGFQIPSFIVEYWPETWAYRVHPLNESAEKLMGDEGDYTEQEYLKLLYRIRNLAIKRAVVDKLGTQKPPQSRLELRRMDRAA